MGNCKSKIQAVLRFRYYRPDRSLPFGMARSSTFLLQEILDQIVGVAAANDVDLKDFRLASRQFNATAEMYVMDRAIIFCDIHACVKGGFTSLPATAERWAKYANTLTLRIQPKQHESHDSVRRNDDWVCCEDVVSSPSDASEPTFMTRWDDATFPDHPSYQKLFSGLKTLKMTSYHMFRALVGPVRYRLIPLLQGVQELDLTINTEKPDVFDLLVGPDRGLEALRNVVEIRITGLPIRDEMWHLRAPSRGEAIRRAEFRNITPSELNPLMQQPWRYLILKLGTLLPCLEVLILQTQAQMPILMDRLIRPMGDGKIWQRSGQQRDGFENAFVWEKHAVETGLHPEWFVIAQRAPEDQCWVSE